MNDNELFKIIAHNIKIERVIRSLTQAQLAELIGVHEKYICLIENGKQNITLKTLNKIANSMKIDISKLFEAIGVIVKIIVPTDIETKTFFKFISIPHSQYYSVFLKRFNIFRKGINLTESVQLARKIAINIVNINEELTVNVKIALFPCLTEIANCH